MLERGNCALVVIDVQEAFRMAIPDFGLIASRISTMIRGASLLGVPIIATEQYPKGLGPTAEELRLSLPENADVVEKSTFSACGEPAFVSKLSAYGTRQIMVCGLETHICVSQTVHDLLARGYEGHILADCVSSRFENDKEVGIEKMRSAGAIVSSTETALFEIMRDSKHEKFKEIQALIK